MKKIKYKMREHIPKTFSGFYVFLATNMAKPAFEGSITIQTNFFYSFGQMRHCIYFDKNRQLYKWLLG